MAVEPRRADIQSLRALAVLLVVATHAQVSLFPGGYVGVDVFFVLSGYLISQIILRETAATGGFDAWRFYARRCKRLLPAMLLVLVCIAAAGWLLAGVEQQQFDAQAGQAASLWLSNFHFASRVVGYFSSGYGGNLFLHTWSLAVEEQFYLVWPWLLLFLLGHWRWQGGMRNRGRLVIGLGAVVAASLSLGVYLAATSVDEGFYLMPGRAWEFALGTLALMLREACDQGRYPILDRLRGKSVLNTAGWSAILVAALCYGPHLRYPGPWALLPCLGTALVLLDDPRRHSESPVSWLMLREPWMQFAGNVSYSLYLWHWPVLSLGMQLIGSGAAERMLLLAFCAALAILTYFAVERPIHRAPFRRSALVLLPSALAMAATWMLMVCWEDAAARRLERPEQAAILVATLDLPSIYARGCDTWHHSADVVPCRLGPATAGHLTVLFGDSALGQWVPAFESLQRQDPDARLMVLTKSGCPAASISFYYEKIRANYDVCDQWRERAIAVIAALKPAQVIIGSAQHRFSREQWLEGTRAVLDRLSPVAGSIVILNPVPELAFDGPACLVRQQNLPEWRRRDNRCEAPVRTASGALLQTLREAAQPYANVSVIDLNEFVCPDGLCRARLPAGIVYRDRSHLTATFAQSLAPQLHTLLPAKPTMTTTADRP
ncbi:MAG: acyltransferase family protein [Usitatibacteraceae bacterium]